MAFYEDKTEEELAAQGQNPQDPDAPQGAPTGQSSVITGQGEAAATTAGTGEQPAGASGEQAGTPFVGINDYINANKPETAKLAQNISGYVGGLGDTARGAITSGQNQYNQAVDQNTVNLNQDLVNTAANIGQGPGAESLNADQNAEFKKMRDANYAGPASLESSQYYQPITQAVTAAQKAGDNTQSLEGLQKVASGYQQANKGRINQGAAAFDASLLSSDEDARGVLSQAREGLGDIPGMLTQAQQDALAKADTAKATTAATAKAIADKFGGDAGVQKQLEKVLDNKAAVAQQQSQQQAAQTAQVLKEGGTPNDSQLQLLGISREQWNALVGDRDYLKNTYGINPYADFNTYTTQLNPATQISGQNIASAEDYARYSALNDLMGSNNQYLSDPSLAGTANMDAVDFNFGGLQGDIKNSISMEKTAADQRAAEAAAARARQEEADRRAAEEKATLIGAGVGFVVAGPVGAVVGAIFCLASDTPVLMADGTYKMVQDIALGEHTKFGGMVLGRGETFCDSYYEYKGTILSANHALYEEGKFVRAKDSKYGVELPNRKGVVYPIWNENHILVSNNKTLFCDMVEYDLEGASDAEKLKALNENCVEVAEQLLKELN